MVRVLVTCLMLLLAATPALGKSLAKDYLKKDREWFESSEGKRRLENVLSYQDEVGCWPKNIDTTASPYRGDTKKLKGTFDNGATVGELRLLAKGVRFTENKEYQKAFERGLKAILETQYENGGWPQSPNPNGYAQHITFNDGTMVGLMTLLREIANDDLYDFVTQELRSRSKPAFEKGVQCILDCQIKVDEQLTVWCAQHDRETFEPRGARVYEHPSLSGGESAGIACLLMSLEDPGPEVHRAIEAAVRWYEEAKLKGIRVESVQGDLTVVKDADASPVWARFYKIETGRPIFSGRDGVIKYNVAEIESERRNGYAWYGTFGRKVKQCYEEYVAEK